MLHARPDYQRRIQDADNIIPAKEPVYLFPRPGCSTQAGCCASMQTWWRAGAVTMNVVRLTRDSRGPNGRVAREEKPGLPLTMRNARKSGAVRLPRRG
jgi:hypothetical protein